jgi:hypothetical protein
MRNVNLINELLGIVKEENSKKNIEKLQKAIEAIQALLSALNSDVFSKVSNFNEREIFKKRNLLAYDWYLKAHTLSKEADIQLPIDCLQAAFILSLRKAKIKNKSIFKFGLNKIINRAQEDLKRIMMAPNFDINDPKFLDYKPEINVLLKKCYKEIGDDNEKLKFHNGLHREDSGVFYTPFADIINEAKKRDHRFSRSFFVKKIRVKAEGKYEIALRMNVAPAIANTFQFMGHNGKVAILLRLAYLSLSYVEECYKGDSLKQGALRKAGKKSTYKIWHDEYLEKSKRYFLELSENNYFDIAAIDKNLITRGIKLILDDLSKDVSAANSENFQKLDQKLGLAEEFRDIFNLYRGRFSSKKSEKLIPVYELPVNNNNNLVDKVSTFADLKKETPEVHVSMKKPVKTHATMEISKEDVQKYQLKMEWVKSATQLTLVTKEISEQNVTVAPPPPLPCDLPENAVKAYIAESEAASVTLLPPPPPKVNLQYKTPVLVKSQPLAAKVGPTQKSGVKKDTLFGYEYGAQPKILRKISKDELFKSENISDFRANITYYLNNFSQKEAKEKSNDLLVEWRKKSRDLVKAMQALMKINSKDSPIEDLDELEAILQEFKDSYNVYLKNCFDTDFEIIDATNIGNTLLKSLREDELNGVPGDQDDPSDPGRLGLLELKSQQDFEENLSTWYLTLFVDSGNEVKRELRIKELREQWLNRCKESQELLRSTNYITFEKNFSALLKALDLTNNVDAIRQKYLDK